MESTPEDTVGESEVYHHVTFDRNSPVQASICAQSEILVERKLSSDAVIAYGGRNQGISLVGHGKKMEYIAIVNNGASGHRLACGHT